MFGVYTRNDETKANKRGATLTPCKTNVPPSTLLFEIVRNTWHEINTWKRQNTLDPTLFFLLLLPLSLRLFRCSILWKRRERERETNKLSKKGKPGRFYGVLERGCARSRISGISILVSRVVSLYRFRSRR